MESPNQCRDIIPYDPKICDERSPDNEPPSDHQSEVADLFDELPEGIHMEAARAIHKAGGRIIYFEIHKGGVVWAQIECLQNHIYRGNLNQSNAVCKICNTLNILHQNDKSIRCVNNLIVQNQTIFEFICGNGHRFILDVKRISHKMCPSCALLAKAIVRHKAGPTGIILDHKSIYVNEQSKLRFHCNKLRHDPLCENPACAELIPRAYNKDCKNFVRCDRDFYATPKQLKYTTYIYHCEYNHNWDKYSEVLKVMRAVEIYFKTRFDNYIPVNVSCYNEYLAIAIIHLADELPAKSLEESRQYCARNKIQLIIIDGRLKKSSKICTELFAQLALFGLINESPRVAVDKTRTTMKRMLRDFRLFENRCV